MLWRQLRNADTGSRFSMYLSVFCTGDCTQGFSLWHTVGGLNLLHKDSRVMRGVLLRVLGVTQGQRAANCIDSTVNPIRQKAKRVTSKCFIASNTMHAGSMYSPRMCSAMQQQCNSKQQQHKDILANLAVSVICCPQQTHLQV